MQRLAVDGIGQHKPIREKVFLSLREAILQGHLQPGKRLVEQELAQQIGISRTPIREALRKLEREGLVDYVPRKGVVVVGISTKDILDICAICAVLEGLAAGLAACARTEAELRELQTSLAEMETCIQTHDLKRLHTLHANFHESIARMSQSPRLYQMIFSLREHVEHCLESSYVFLTRLQDGWYEHEELVEAIAAGDRVRAERTARNHLMQVREAFSKRMLE